MNLLLKTMLSGLLIANPTYSTCTITDSLKTTLLQTCKAAEVVSVFVATHLGLALLHEGAHVLTAKIALAAGAETREDNWELNLKIFNYALIPTATYPHFKNDLINVLVTTIAPTMGLAGSYGTLKATNIVSEYLKDSNIKRAFIDGMKKELINHDQNTSIRAAALFNLSCNAAVLFPFKIRDSYESHGYEILKDLKIISK